MKTRLTPLHLKLLIHAYVHPEPWPYQNETVAEYLRHLESSGLIEPCHNTDYYVCTDIGKAHMEQLLTLPFPTQGWFSASGEPIKIN